MGVVEKCEQCGKEIKRPVVGLLWSGRAVVCAACFEALERQRAQAQGAAGKTGAVGGARPAPGDMRDLSGLLYAGGVLAALLFGCLVVAVIVRLVGGPWSGTPEKDAMYFRGVTVPAQTAGLVAFAFFSLALLARIAAGTDKLGAAK